MSNNATTTHTLRAIERSATWYYHRYRAAEEALHTECKAIMSGQRLGTRILDRLLRQRDQAYRDLLPYLQEIAARIRRQDGLLPHQDDDTRVAEYFRERQARIEAAGMKKTDEPNPA